MPARSSTPSIDPDLLRQLYQQCNGYVQRVFEKLKEEHGLAVKYSSLARWLRQLRISLPAPTRCDRVPDEPGAEMQHDTSPFTIPLGQIRTKLERQPRFFGLRIERHDLAAAAAFPSPGSIIFVCQSTQGGFEGVRSGGLLHQGFQKALPEGAGEIRSRIVRITTSWPVIPVPWPNTSGYGACGV